MIAIYWTANRPRVSGVMRLLMPKQVTKLGELTFRILFNL